MCDWMRLAASSAVPSPLSGGACSSWRMPMTFSSRQPSLRRTVFTGGAALSVKIPFAGLISGRVFVIVQADNKTIESGIVRAGRVPQAERGANPHEWVTVKPSLRRDQSDTLSAVLCLRHHRSQRRFIRFCPCGQIRRARLFVLYRTVKGAAIWSSRMSLG